jgi:hypothetical protein
MPNRHTPRAVPKKHPKAGRNLLEIIRFPSRDAELQAIGALIDWGMLNFSANRVDEWLVLTPVALKLRELGVPFEWITEHV